MYKIIETPCYPNKYKLVHVGYRDDNAACNYFKTIKEAETAAIKRKWNVTE